MLERIPNNIKIQLENIFIKHEDLKSYEYGEIWNKYLNRNFKNFIFEGRDITELKFVLYSYSVNMRECIYINYGKVDMNKLRGLRGNFIQLYEIGLRIVDIEKFILKYL